LAEIQNIIIKKPLIGHNEFLYGKRIFKPAKVIADIVIQALRKLGIDYAIKST
jgi:hypothetical protein